MRFTVVRTALAMQETQSRRKESTKLEDKSSTLGLLVTTQFEVLATLDRELHLVLAG